MSLSNRNFIHILLLLNQNIFITNLLIFMYSSRLIVSFCFSTGLIFKPAVEGIAESINVTIFTSGVMSQLKSFLFASFGHLLYILRFQFD